MLPRKIKIKMKRKLSKLSKIILDCYRELYANSTPKADFDKLMEEAPLNEFGQKAIDFDSYTIDEEVYDRILKDHEKKHKLKGMYLESFRFQVHLGCSPRVNRKILK